MTKNGPKIEIRLGPESGWGSILPDTIENFATSSAGFEVVELPPMPMKIGEYDAKNPASWFNNFDKNKTWGATILRVFVAVLTKGTGPEHGDFVSPHGQTHTSLEAGNWPTNDDQILHKTYTIRNGM